MKKIILTIVTVAIVVGVLAIAFNADAVRNWLISDNTTTIESTLI